MFSEENGDIHLYKRTWSKMQWIYNIFFEDAQFSQVKVEEEEQLLDVLKDDNRYLELLVTVLMIGGQVKFRGPASCYQTERRQASMFSKTPIKLKYLVSLGAEDFVVKSADAVGTLLRCRSGWFERHCEIHSNYRRAGIPIGNRGARLNEMRLSEQAFAEVCPLCGPERE